MSAQRTGKPAACGPVDLRKTASKRSKAFRIVWTSKSQGPGNCPEIKHHSFSFLFFASWAYRWVSPWSNKELYDFSQIELVPDGSSSPWSSYSGWYHFIIFHHYVTICYVITRWSFWNGPESDNSMAIPNFPQKHIHIYPHISTNHPLVGAGDHLPDSSSSPIDSAMVSWIECILLSHCWGCTCPSTVSRISRHGHLPTRSNSGRSLALFVVQLLKGKQYQTTTCLRHSFAFAVESWATWKNLDQLGNHTKITCPYI